MRYYEAMKSLRRGQELYTVESYFGEGTQLRGMFFIFHGDDGKAEESLMEDREVIVVKFDRGREGRDTVEKGCGKEEKWGTVVRISRRRVRREEGRGTLGGLLEAVWEGCEMRGEYDGLMD